MALTTERPSDSAKRASSKDYPPPLSISNEAGIDWDYVTDVVVVGFGCAGASAALEARANGADVIVFDRFRGGGATAFSGGVVYAGGTSYQTEAGFNDTPEEMYKYLREEVGNVITDATLRRFCEKSNDDMEFLVRNGVRFSGAPYLEKATYPPEGLFLYYSGNERVSSYSRIAVPAPRGHRTVGEGLTGRIFYDALRNSAELNGVKLVRHAKVSRLVVNKAGDVIGAEVIVLPENEHEHHDRLYSVVNPIRPFNSKRADRATAKAEMLESRQGEKRYVRARGGVIIAAGGLMNNRKMIAKHRPAVSKIHASLLRLGSMGDDGSGIRLGQSVNGAVNHLENYVIAGPFFPPNALLKGIMVNRGGKRFINETSYSGFLGDAAVRQEDGVVWLIIDGRSMRALLKEIFFPPKGMFKIFMLPAMLNLILGGTHTGRNPHALARRCRIDALALGETIRNFNEAANSGSEDEFGKARDYIRPLQGRLYALNLNADNPFTFRQAISQGGLVVDEITGSVMDEDGRPISGLYAAGRSAVGICSSRYLSGLSLADGVFSGRRAGVHSANRALQDAQRELA